MTLPIDVRDLLGAPGSSRTVLIEQPIPSLETVLAEVPDDLPVDAELLLESVVEGILVSGPVWGVMTLACARCLKGFQSEFHVRVQELFAPEARPEDDEYPVNDGAVDLEPMIRDAVILSMPFAPLCRSSCLGLCERCGGDRNLGECACGPVVDDAWAPLLDLKLDVLEVEERTDAGGRDRSTR